MGNRLAEKGVRPILWHDVPVTPIHTPGHCWAHAAFVIPWAGMLTVCTGDTLQYRTGGVVQSLPVFRNDTAWPERGHIRTYDKLAELGPDLVLGGHSAYFYHGDGGIMEDWRAAAIEAMGLAAACLHDGDLMRAMPPPGYDEVRPICEKLLDGG